MTQPPNPPPREDGGQVQQLTRILVRGAASKAVSSAAAGAVGAVGWPVILVVAAILLVVALIVAIVVIAAVARNNDERAQFADQCQSRLGYSVGNTASVVVVAPGGKATTGSLTTAPTHTIELQPATTTPATTTASPTPTTSTTATTTTAVNPYASLSIPPTLDERDAACASAVQQGTFEAAPIATPGGELGKSAAIAANEQVGLTVTEDGGTLDGPTNGNFSAAALVRYAYHRASGGELILPQLVRDQILVGPRVDSDYISAGDLVFYNFTPTDGPTAVMIAIDSQLGVDATTLDRPIGIAALPTGNVIVRRPTLPAGGTTSP